MNILLTLIVNSPTSSFVKMVLTKLMISASGIIASHVPVISKSYKYDEYEGNKEVQERQLTACENSLIRPFDMTGLSRR